MNLVLDVDLDGTWCLLARGDCSPRGPGQLRTTRPTADSLQWGVSTLSLLCLCVLCAACSRSGDEALARQAAVIDVPKAQHVLLAPLPALQRARLDYVFDAAERVRASWPFMAADEACVLLIEAEVQWVLNCAHVPTGFAPNGELYRRQKVYRHVGGTFASAGQARSTAELLAQTPAAAHVPLPEHMQTNGLPGDKPWLVIGSLEALAAFHPAFPEATTEAWVSVAVHELIHTHQLRAPGSAAMLAQIHAGQRDPQQLTRRFGRDARFRALVEREYALLTKAAERAPDDRRSARQALRAWLALYTRRAQQLGTRAQLAQDDALFSYLEGVARFVESDFLDNASQHPAFTPPSDARFHHYALFRGRGYLGSPNRQLDEQYFYAIGYHLCVLLERLDPSWKQRVHTQSRWLVDVAQQVASARD